MRRLLTTRRHVPLDRADEYLSAWRTVRTAVEHAGGRAWIFRGAGHEDQFVEFIEWADGSVPPADDDIVAAAAAHLDVFAAPRTVEDWEEAQ